MSKGLTWRPVEIDGSAFAEGASDLIGIEECTDYDMDSFKSPKKVLKRKIEKMSLQPPKKKKKPIKDVTSTDSNRVSALLSDNFSPSTTGNTAQEIKAASKKLKNVKKTANMDAWKVFQLPEPILKALKELDFTQPTHIQSLTLPAAILGKRDILGAAETGSGKTLAFGLPILSGILKIKEKQDQYIQSEKSASSDSEESDFEAEIDDSAIGCVKSMNIKDSVVSKPLYALILTPTRELAMQVKNHLTSVAKYTGIHIALVVGGMAAVKQERILNKAPEIVVATPGRLWEMVQLGNSHLSQIDNIRFLAVDETDRMLERGHFKELQDLLERLNLDERKKKQRQNFVFSATLTLVHELPKYLKNKKKLSHSKRIEEMTSTQKLQKIVDILNIINPKVVDITEGKGTSDTLTECRITCAIDEKDYYVYYFLKKHRGRTLIFCNSIGCVKRLTNLLSLLDCHPLPLHASMQQRQRFKNLEKFRDNEEAILIATDVAARGLDIPSVEHVLHYQTPRTSEGYVHRSGRTARASRQGITVLLIEPNELHNYLKLCRTLDKSEDLPTFPVQQNYLQAVKQRVDLARELDKLQLYVKKTNSESGWFQKAAEDMDILVDDFVKKFDNNESVQRKKVAEIKQKHLATLLAKSIFPKGINANYSLTSSTALPVIQAELQEEKAIDVMKNAIDNSVKEKKTTRNIRLYKPNKRKGPKQTSIGKIQAGRGGRKEKINRKKKSHRRR